MGIEKCSECGGIHYRNAPCPPALLAKKAASAAASSHRLDAKSGELPLASKGRASGKKGAATKTTNKSPAVDAQLEGGDGPQSRPKAARAGHRAVEDQSVPDGGRINSSGGSSGVEHSPSKRNVAGSNPARRSKYFAEARGPSPDRAREPSDITATSAILSQAEDAAAHLAPKRRGRKPTGFDKAAYNREFMRKKRAEEAARLKAEREGK